MLYYLGLTPAYPWLRTFNVFLYHGILLLAVLTAMYLVARRLSAAGYEKKQILIICAFTLLVAFPLGITTSHAAAMFYRPIDFWSWQALMQAAFTGSTHTFHASIIGPAIILLVFFRLMKYRALELIDMVFLYVPVAHAIGRAACLIIGCCWGRSVLFDFFGIFSFRFRNPVPLYAILINLAIFFLLRRIYEAIYNTEAPNRGYSGAILGAYLVLYGGVRMTLEIFRVESIVAFGLSQAQIVMIGFILIGSAILFVAALRNRSPREQKTASQEKLTRYLCLVGFAGSYMLGFFALYRLMRTHVLGWPFAPVNNLTAAYSAILEYSPVILFPVLALVWLKLAGLPLWTHFKWRRFSWLLYPALAASLGYSVYLLVLRQPELRGLVFWPPVIILSLINAVSEELTFRHGFFRLLETAGYGPAFTVAAQAALYSLAHFGLGSAVFGTLALCYGLLLGALRAQTQSVTPCIICHLLIDIGCIGYPMLAY